MTIAVEDSGTNNMFVPTGIVADYARNNSPIEDIDILRSKLSLRYKFLYDTQVDTE